MQKSARNVDDSKRLINRLLAALSELLNMKSLSNILHTCSILGEIFLTLLNLDFVAIFLISMTASQTCRIISSNLCSNSNNKPDTNE